MELIKFIYSEKATIFCEISILLLSYVVLIKSKVEVSQTFVAFSEYTNFTLTGTGQILAEFKARQCAVPHYYLPP